MTSEDSLEISGSVWFPLWRSSLNKSYSSKVGLISVYRDHLAKAAVLERANLFQEYHSVLS